MTEGNSNIADEHRWFSLCSNRQKFCFLFIHSHKKRKDSLETRAELAVLRTYVENQAIPEPIRLYRASKCKQTKEQAARTVYGLIFLLFYKIIVSFFSFFCQDANKTRSNRAIIGYNLSKKHKLTLYKTQSEEPNYVDYKFELAT